MSRRLLWASVIIGCALSLVGAYAVATQRLVVGSPEGGWVYRYLAEINGRTVEAFAIASVLAAAALSASWPQLRRMTKDAEVTRTSAGDWTLIIAWCVLATGLQGLIRSLTPYSLGTMFASDAANSFYSVALKLDMPTILGDFERLRPTWALHAQSNLPGKLLLVRALVHVSTRAHVLAWLCIILSNLGGVLMFFFVRALFADRFIAAISAILYLFTPAKLFFFPLLNTVTPVAVLACGCLLMRWLATRQTAYAALLGAAVYGLILFEPSTLIIGVLFGALVARAIVRGDVAPGAAAGQIGAGILAFGAIYAVMQLAFGFDLVTAFRHIAADAADFNVIARRPYSIWIRQNLFDFLFGVGLCQVLLLAAALGDGIVHASSGRKAPGPITLLCVTLVAIVGLADVMGVNRGEVIRLWVFLACLWQIPAAYVCARINSRVAIALVLLSTLLQDALGSSMIGFIVPG